MTKEFQVGIIGYGGFGQYLHRAWEGHPQVTLAAVADPDHARQPAAPCRYYPRWQDLLADPEIDIIAVATPCSSHAEIAIAALRQGKHLLVEKPLATSLENARKIIAARDASGKVAAVDYMLRYNPLVRAIGALNRGNTLGTLRRIVVENYASDEQLPPEHWFWDLTVSGGILVEHGVHFFDLADHLSRATPVKVGGVAARRKEGQLDRVQATVLYDNGLVASHYHAFSTPGFFEETTIRLVYDLARIELTGWIPLRGQLTALVASDDESTLDALPNLEILSRKPIAQLTDDSRPKGWGLPTEEVRDQGKVRSGGIEYPVDTQIEGVFQADGDKQTVFSDCLRALQGDFLAAICDPQRPVGVPLEDGLQSLNVALQATAAALGTLPSVT